MKYNRIPCEENLKSLWRELSGYALDHRGAYPEPNKWCDLIPEKTYYSKRDLLKCPSDKVGPGSYAMNPNCRLIYMPGDIVLAFESKPGWNQNGGPELMKLDNHVVKGCNVLFKDGHVEFVEPRDFNSLKWKKQ